VEDDATPDAPARDKGGAHLEWRAVRGEEFPVAGAALGPPARGFTENADRRAPSSEHGERVVVLAFVFACPEGLGGRRQGLG
jgi:hypothetical protein